MQLHTPGGHSSIPPPHTGIGIISNIVQSLESAPYSPSLSTQSPIFSLLQCAAEHGELASNLKANVRAGARPGGKGDKARMRAAKLFADIGRPQQYLVSTSQAVDVISGGVKGGSIFLLRLVESTHIPSFLLQPCSNSQRLTRAH